MRPPDYLNKSLVMSSNNGRQNNSHFFKLDQIVDNNLSSALSNNQVFGAPSWLNNIKRLQ